MTTDLKRVLRETEISSSALAASESRLYGYSLLRLLPSRYAEKLGLEREALQDVQQIGDFLDHLDGGSHEYADALGDLRLHGPYRRVPADG